MLCWLALADRVHTTELPCPNLCSLLLVGVSATGIDILVTTGSTFHPGRGGVDYWLLLC